MLEVPVCYDFQNVTVAMLISFTFLTNKYTFNVHSIFTSFTHLKIMYSGKQNKIQ